MKKKKDNKIVYGVGLFITLILLLIVTVWNNPDVVMKDVCKQEPYQTTEKYTEWVNSKNCNYDTACRCTHVNWLGLGVCDSCQCDRERTVTKYREVCITIMIWQSPNYQESWASKYLAYTMVDGKMKLLNEKN